MRIEASVVSETSPTETGTSRPERAANIVVSAATGADAISVESAVDIPAARQKFDEAGVRTPIIGAVHPIKALLEGTPEDVAAAVRKSAEDGAALISPDCAVAPNTPLKQLIAMVEATEKL